MTTRNITVTINDFDGLPLKDAKVSVRLVGLGNGVTGATSPGIKDRITDAAGQCIFVLWQNEQLYSDTHYEITSTHPTTKKIIHNKEVFYVGTADADVKDLINVAAAQVDPNAVLLAQIAADRATAETSAAIAVSSAALAATSQATADGRATFAQQQAAAAAAASAIASAAELQAEDAALRAEDAASNNVGLSVDYNTYSYSVEST